MYQDEIFEKALCEVREEKFTALKQEISSMEIAIEKFLCNILECTSSIAERDFHIAAI